MKHVDVSIRRADSLADYSECVDLQREVWGFRDNEDVSGQTMLMLANKLGGNVLIASDGGKTVGFAFALPAWRQDRRPFWWSHMTAVKPEYRNQHVGLLLKQRQREAALTQRIDRIEWTFDPLQAMNAYFNLRKLGVTISEYEDNVYGFTSSPLHRGLPTDRFVASWELESERVSERTEGKSTLILRDVDGIPRINPQGTAIHLNFKDTVLSLEILSDIAALKSSDIESAKKLQNGIRTACHHYFQAGYTITDFIMPQALYILERT